MEDVVKVLNIITGKKWTVEEDCVIHWRAHKEPETVHTRESAEKFILAYEAELKKITTAIREYFEQKELKELEEVK